MKDYRSPRPPEKVEILSLKREDFAFIAQEVLGRVMSVEKKWMAHKTGHSDGKIPQYYLCYNLSSFFSDLSFTWITEKGSSPLHQ